MSITLSKTETQILLDAAGRDGALQFPETMKPITRQRMLGRFEAEGLIVAAGDDGASPLLTLAGYRAVGLRAPRRTGRAAQPSKPEPVRSSTDSTPCAGTKRALLAEMLGRRDGASLDELMEATGWLPHTTRAALSRIRRAGQVLAKSRRDDGRTAYRIEAAA